MILLNDEFRELTSHMAILADEMRDLVHRLHESTDESELSKLHTSLADKQQRHAALKDELLLLGTMESEATPIGYAHSGIERVFPIGFGDGEYYLDND